jgi:site-specific DNA-methyltransferase (adenine-specific)
MDWETPQELFDKLNHEFNFTIDLAANEHNRKCDRWFGPGGVEEDALSVSWEGVRGWLNPPYGRGLARWVRKAYEESRDGASLVVLLIPSRTDTTYWHDYVIRADEVRFLRGRLKFVGATASAPFPSAIVVFGKMKKT